MALVFAPSANAVLGAVRPERGRPGVGRDERDPRGRRRASASRSWPACSARTAPTPSPQAFTDGVSAALPVGAAVLAAGALAALLVPGRRRAAAPAARSGRRWPRARPDSGGAGRGVDSCAVSRLPARRPEGPGPHRGPRRPAVRPPAVRLGRGRHPRRATGPPPHRHGRPAQLRLPEPPSQQALADARPEVRRRAGAVPAPRGRADVWSRTCVPRSSTGSASNTRRSARSTPGSSTHRSRLRAGRARLAARRRRPDRPGHGRAHERHRRPGRGAGARGLRGDRPRRGPARRRRHPRGPARSRPHRRGRWVRTSLLEAAIGLLDFQAARYTVDGVVRPGSATTTHARPDGHVRDRGRAREHRRDRRAHLARATRVLDLPELLEVSGFADRRPARGPPRGGQRAGRREAADPHRRSGSPTWRPRGRPCRPGQPRQGEVFADAQVQHLEMVQPVEHPEMGELRLIANAATLARLPRALRTAAPAAGEHTQEILAELGLSPPTSSGTAKKGAF